MSIWLCLLSAVVVYAADREWLDNIIGDVYEQLTETGAVDYEELQEELLDLAAHPINLNAARASDLERLRFLNDIQIDAILLYVYQRPMQDISELQLIDCLHDYDIRNLRAFVFVAPIEKSDRLYPREVFRLPNTKSLRVSTPATSKTTPATLFLCRRDTNSTTRTVCSSG